MLVCFSSFSANIFKASLMNFSDFVFVSCVLFSDSRGHFLFAVTLRRTVSTVNNSGSWHFNNKQRGVIIRVTYLFLFAFFTLRTCICMTAVNKHRWSCRRLAPQNTINGILVFALLSCPSRFIVVSPRCDIVSFEHFHFVTACCSISSKIW